jgi:hypothetical protein
VIKDWTSHQSYPEALKENPVNFSKMPAMIAPKVFHLRIPWLRGITNKNYKKNFGVHIVYLFVL